VTVPQKPRFSASRTANDQVPLGPCVRPSNPVFVFLGSPCRVAALLNRLRPFPFRHPESLERAPPFLESSGPRPAPFSSVPSSCLPLSSFPRPEPRPSIGHPVFLPVLLCIFREFFYLSGKRSFRREPVSHFHYLCSFRVAQFRSVSPPERFVSPPSDGLVFWEKPVECLFFLLAPRCFNRVLF